MTSSGKLLIVSTPIGEADDPSRHAIMALTNAHVVLCCSEAEGMDLLRGHGVETAVTLLDPRLPTADVAAIVGAIDDGSTIAALCRTSVDTDVDTMARLRRHCEEQGVDVELIPPHGTSLFDDDMHEQEQDVQGGGERPRRPQRRGGQRRPAGQQQRPASDRGPRPERPRDDRGPRQERQRDDRGPRPERQRDVRGPRPERPRDDRGPRPERPRDDRGPRPERPRDDRGPRPERPRNDRGPRPDRRDRGRPERREQPRHRDRDRDRERGPRQPVSYDEVQPMSNETMFGYAPRKRRPEQAPMRGNPQYGDRGRERDRDHDRRDDGPRPARRGGKRSAGPGPQQRRDRPQGGSGPQRGRKQAGGKGRPVKGRGGKTKAIGMVTKKRAEREPKTAKVYSSQMFMYRENLDERKPTERTLRTRRKKSSDDT